MNFNRIVLGTAQLGLNYGINNQVGKPSEKEVNAILSRAFEVGIRELDTAEAYGDSQKAIGNFQINNPDYVFSIITKMKFDNFNLTEKLKNNLSELQVEKLDGYMFHNYRDYVKNPLLIENLLKLKNDGLINRIGISLYTNEEVVNALKNPTFEFIQIPYNILDNLNHRKEVLEFAKLKGVQVYARSVFLQGIFFLDNSKFSKSLKPLEKYIDKLKKISNNYGLSIQQLCLGYVLFNELISKVLIGIDSLKQLNENIKLIENLQISDEIVKEIDEIKVKEIEILNPTYW